MTAPNDGAPGGASRHHLGRSEIYKPAFGIDRCELCGEVRRWALADRARPRPRDCCRRQEGVARGHRVAYVCSAHAGEDLVGRPVKPPNSTMVPGSSGRRPQEAALFTATSLKRGSWR